MQFYRLSGSAVYSVLRPDDDNDDAFAVDHIFFFSSAYHLFNFSFNFNNFLGEFYNLSRVVMLMSRYHHVSVMIHLEREGKKRRGTFTKLKCESTWAAV